MEYPEYTKQVGTKYLNSDQIGSPTLKNEYGSLNNLLKVALTLGYNENIIENIAIEGDYLKVGLPLNHGYTENQVIRLTGFTEASMNQQFRILDYTSTNITIHKPIEVSETPVPSETSKIRVAPLGYSIIYNNEEEGVICFKNKSTQSPAVLKLIDKIPPNEYDPSWAKFARVVIGESIDSKGDFINNRKAPFHYQYPDAEKTGNKVSGSSGVHGFAKWDYAIEPVSSIAETYTGRGIYPTDWRIIGDDKTFYLMIRPQGRGKYGYNLLGYGNYESNNPKETSNICLQARDSFNPASSVQAGFSRFWNYFGSLTSEGSGFLLTNIHNNHQSSNYNRSQNISLYCDSTSPWRSTMYNNPNPITGQIITERLGIKDCDNYFRGYHRGLKILYGSTSLPDQFINSDGSIILEVQEPYTYSTDYRAPMVFTLADWEEVA